MIDAENDDTESELWAEPPKEEQIALFDDIREPWELIWQGMPEYTQEDLTAWKSLIVHFASPGDLKAFAELVNQKLTPKTRFMWFPEPDSTFSYMTKRYQDAA